MAVWLRTVLSLGVITLNVASATSTGQPPSVSELSLSLSTISDFPQIKLYSSQSPISDKFKFNTLETHENAKSHDPEKIQVEAKRNNDTLEVTVLPSSAFLWKKVKKGGEVNVTQEEDYSVGMPVAAALKTSGNGYTRSDGTYMVNDDDGGACVMAYFICHATIYYSDSNGDYQSKVISPAENSEVFGMCDRKGQISEVSVRWGTFTLTLRFGKDDLTDSWFVSQFFLTYDLSDSTFSDSLPGQSPVTVSSTTERKYWQTNNAYSFRCLLLHDVQLSDPNTNSTATIHFDEARVQAFCEMEYFRRPKHCIHRVHRDEMVPVTVGASLAGATVLTVIVYGIFRYFKIKKVQYDTMA